MNTFKRFIRAIPPWAFALVALVLFINILYIHYKWQRPANGTVIEYLDGQWIYTYVKPGSTGEKAGIIPGDTLVSINSLSFDEWSSIQRIKAGDTVTVKILREGQPLTLHLSHSIRNAEFLWFYVVIFIIVCLFSAASLILIYKKPHDRSVRLFFLYILCIAVCQNALHIVFPEFLASVVVAVFNFCACFLGPVIVHFHMIFPRSSKLMIRFPWSPTVLYVSALLIFLIYTPFSILSYYYGTDFFNSASVTWNRILLHWITLNYFLAISIVIYQYVSIKDTLARNQLLIIIIGTAFGMLAPILFNFFNNVFA